MANSKKKEIPWNKIKLDYLAGVGYEKLAATYKINSSTIRSKASRDKWQQHAATFQDKIEQSVASEMAAQEIDRIKDLLKISDKFKLVADQFYDEKCYLDKNKKVDPYKLKAMIESMVKLHGMLTANELRDKKAEVTETKLDQFMSGSALWNSESID